MRVLAIVLVLVAAVTGCRAPEPEGKSYELQGQILAVRPERREVVIKHRRHQGLHARHDDAVHGEGPALLKTSSRAIW